MGKHGPIVKMNSIGGLGERSGINVLKFIIGYCLVVYELKAGTFK